MRNLCDIAADIRGSWVDRNGDPNVNYGAVPYLQAMECLYSIDGQYGADSAKSIVRYFLSNASGFRGEAARALKAELKAML